MHRFFLWVGSWFLLVFLTLFAGAEMTPRYSTEDLPKPLSEVDAHLYKTTIKLQQNSHWQGALFVRSAIQNNLLASWLDYNAFTQPFAPQGAYLELNKFIKTYPTHPHVMDIYKKAKELKYPGDEKLAEPKTEIIELKINENIEPPKLKNQIKRTALEQRRATDLIRRIQSYLNRDDYASAEKLILSDEALSVLSFYEADSLYVKILRLLFNEGKDESVIHLATQVSSRSGDYFGEAWWLAGLSAWRMQNYAQARDFFAEITKRPWLHDNLIYGAYYWQARCSFMLLEYNEWQKPLLKAAQDSNNFYGLLASETLGKLYLTNPKARMDRLKILLGTPKGQQFLALVQIGQIEWAQDELLAYINSSSDQDRLILLWVASEIGWLDFVYKESEKLKKYDIDMSESLPRIPKEWVPSTGMVLDEALTLAVIQKESRFKTDARSRAGALGLMQITSQTKQQTEKIFDINNNNDLSSAAENIYIGQRYMNYLLSDSWFDGNLFFVLAGWNAGPSKSERWQKETWRLADDPLFWLESIPIRETRLYVKDVSANLWKYRNRLGQSAPTLEAIAQGQEPIYRNIDPEQSEILTEY
ncbi:MAG: transglycosylase SLT domain-containing protein [Alphaproteobacteria bacterium]